MSDLDLLQKNKVYFMILQHAVTVFMSIRMGEVFFYYHATYICIIISSPENGTELSIFASVATNRSINSQAICIDYLPGKYCKTIGFT